MSELNWYYLNLWKRVDEKVESIRRVRATSDCSVDSSFTLPPLVTIVSVNDEGDDLDEAEERIELRQSSGR